MISKYQVTSPHNDQNQDTQTIILVACVNKQVGNQSPRTGRELLLLSDLDTAMLCASVSSSKMPSEKGASQVCYER